MFERETESVLMAVLESERLKGQNTVEEIVRFEPTIDALNVTAYRCRINSETVDFYIYRSKGKREFSRSIMISGLKNVMEMYLPERVGLAKKTDEETLEDILSAICESLDFGMAVLEFMSVNNFYVIQFLKNEEKIVEKYDLYADRKWDLNKNGNPFERKEKNKIIFEKKFELDFYIKYFDSENKMCAVSITLELLENDTWHD